MSRPSLSCSRSRLQFNADQTPCQRDRRLGTGCCRCGLHRLDGSDVQPDSDVTGGVRFVVEEETARPRPGDFVPAAGCWIGLSAPVSLSWRGACPCDGQRTQRRGCRTGPGGDVPDASRIPATGDPFRPQPAPSRVPIPKLMAPTTRSSMSTTTASVVGRTGLCSVG